MVCKGIILKYCRVFNTGNLSKLGIIVGKFFKEGDKFFFFKWRFRLGLFTIFYLQRKYFKLSTLVLGVGTVGGECQKEI